MKNKVQVVLQPFAGRHKACGGTRAKAKLSIVGRGKPEFAIPDSSTLVKNGLALAREQFGEGLASANEAPSGETDSELQSNELNTAIDGGWDPWYLQRYIVSHKRSGDIATLVKCADGLQKNMAQRHLDGLVYDRFDTMEGIVFWAKENMADKFQPAIESLSMHLHTLKERYQEALPELVQALGDQYPKTSVPELFSLAVDLLDKELSQVLYVLNIYADAFGQYRNGVYTENLAIINYFLEQAFLLFQSINLEEVYDQCGIPEARVPTSTFNVGDVYLSRFSRMSLSTIPAANGPLDIHAVQIPFEMLEIFAVMIPLIAHELRHNILSDVPGMEEELIDALVENISGDEQMGKFTLSSETIEFGGQKLPAMATIIKFFVDTLTEVDADLCGGALFSGISYFYSMLSSFPAMMVRDRPIANAASLLRTDSVYFLDDLGEGGAKVVSFEVHGPDYVRALLIIEALRQMGFEEEVKRAKNLLGKTVGEEVPEYCEFQDGSGQFEEVIRIPLADIKKVIPTGWKNIYFQSR